MLHVEDIHFAFGEKKLLKGVSFSAAKGEIIVLIGVSGSGKTTLFRLITGLLSPSQGRIIIGGYHLPKGAPLTTYMRQDDLLLPWRTVMGNLLLFSELGKKRKDRRTLRDEACLLLKKMGLEGYEGVYPHTLSGGMRHRIALARALLQNRPLMLLDEPFASLDVILREQLYSLLRSIRDQYQKTIVMVTHDFRDAIALADRILVLANGRIIATHALTPTDREQGERLIGQVRAELSDTATA
jgi:ABC-type nitrate/sulfonate/bicarbonate transport system ATPase subunit